MPVTANVLRSNQLGWYVIASYTIDYIGLLYLLADQHS